MWTVRYCPIITIGMDTRCLDVTGVCVESHPPTAAARQRFFESNPIRLNGQAKRHADLRCSAAQNAQSVSGAVQPPKSP